MIGQIANKNYRKIPEWREQNPECQNTETQQYEFCIQMMRNSLGEIGEEQDKLDEKIMLFTISSSVVLLKFRRNCVIFFNFSLMTADLVS
jgi:hypothetical protein